MTTVLFCVHVCFFLATASQFSNCRCCPLIEQMENIHWYQCDDRKIAVAVDYLILFVPNSSSSSKSNNALFVFLTLVCRYFFSLLADILNRICCPQTTVNVFRSANQCSVALHECACVHACYLPCHAYICFGIVFVRWVIYHQHVRVWYQCLCMYACVCVCELFSTACQHSQSGRQALPANSQTQIAINTTETVIPDCRSATYCTHKCVLCRHSASAP